MGKSLQKKIAAVNDLTGFGRCALTVAIPVISHMKIQCCPVPTSILSNHTGYTEYFFDAFNQMGGKLSFCLALLDENNNGFILNSVHSTEGCYSYTKEIQNGICEISLGNEEEKALNMAMEIID